MKLHEWLDTGIIARLAELIAVNNMNFEVKGNIGKPMPVGPEVNRYGRIVLTIPEAFELTYLRGWFDALAQGMSDEYMKDVQARIGREMAGMVIQIPTQEQKEQILGSHHQRASSRRTG